MKKYFLNSNFVFIFLLIICLSFLIFQPGVWAYLDAAYQFAMSYTTNVNIISVVNEFYVFDGEGTQISAGRYIHMLMEIGMKLFFGVKWGAIVFFLFYFVITYFTTKEVLSISISKQYAGIGALIYTFNPFSIYMMNVVGFTYAYAAIPLIVLGTYWYFYGSKQILGLFVSAMGTIFLTGYTRLTLMYILFLIAIMLVYYKDAFLIITKKAKACILYFFIITLANLPFIFSILYPLQTQEKDYFSGVSNYSLSSKGWGYTMYNDMKSQPFQTLLSPTEPLLGFSYKAKDYSLLHIFSGLFFIFIISTLLRKSSQISKRHHLVFSVGAITFVFGAICRILPYYVSPDNFVYIVYDLLPFLANSSAWAFRFMLAGISILLTLSLQYNKIKIRIIMIGLSLIYCFWTVSALLSFSQNEKLHTIHFSEGDAVSSILHRPIGLQENPPIGGISYPQGSILFDWSPYPISVRIPGFLSPIMGDLRAAPSKQVEFSATIKRIPTVDAPLNNLAILDISSFLVYQGVRNKEKNEQFDWYTDNDNIGLATQTEYSLANNTGLILIEKNDLYSRYDVIDRDLSSFSLYLPKTIISLQSHKELFNTGVDLVDRTIFIDELAYKKPQYVGSGYIIPNTDELSISIKTPKKDRYAYYAKISNIQSGQDLMLQLNKTFHVGYRVKIIEKKTFDMISCEESMYYPISNNSFCWIDQRTANLHDFSNVLLAPSYKSVDHFEGNIIGNARILHDAQPNADGDMYIAIANTKTYLFTITKYIALSVITILLLFLLGSFGWKYKIKTRE